MDAEGGEGLAAPRVDGVEQRDEDARARSADGVAERDGAPVQRRPGRARASAAGQHRQALGGEGLVQLARRSIASAVEPDLRGPYGPWHGPMPGSTSVHGRQARTPPTASHSASPRGPCRALGAGTMSAAARCCSRCASRGRLDRSLLKAASKGRDAVAAASCWIEAFASPFFCALHRHDLGLELLLAIGAVGAAASAARRPARGRAGRLDQVAAIHVDARWKASSQFVDDAVEDLAVAAAGPARARNRNRARPTPSRSATTTPASRP